MRYVVVGLHAAGRSACHWLKKLDPQAEIIGIDPSASPAYARPLISYVLDEELPWDKLEKHVPVYWPKDGIQILPEKAVSLDPGRKEIFLDSGRKVAYDRLLLCTGSTPRQVRVKGDKDAICYFRGRKDLKKVLDRVTPGGVAAVLGGGLVGFKLTMGLIVRKMKINLIVSSPRPLALNVDEYVGDKLGEKLSSLPDVDLFTSTSVTAIEPGQKRKLKLILDTGQDLEVDLVAAGKGVIPNTSWLEGSGLETDYGLLVDDYLKTNVDDVYAAGDIAQAYDLLLEQKNVNAIWPVAVEQGRVAAYNMAGFKMKYPGSMSMNAIPVFDSHMISVGLVNPRYTKDCTSMTFSDKNGAYLNLIFREQRLIGAIGLNATPRLGELAYAIKQRLKQNQIPTTWIERSNSAPICFYRHLQQS